MIWFRRIAGLLLHPYRRLYLTGTGWVFSAVTLAMGLIAVNTGHNLFHLAFGLLLSTVIVSGILSERVLRCIEVERHIPPDVTARIPFPVTVTLRNQHRRRMAYSVTVGDQSTFCSRHHLGYLPILRPSDTGSFAYFGRVDRRGLYRFGPVLLKTRFPFGFFEKVRVIPAQDSLIAFPAQREVFRSYAWISGKDRSGSKKWRSGEELLSLRPALPEDDHRFIHWRTSARTGELMLREFAEEVKHPWAFFFDNRGRESEVFERSVENAASLLRLLVSSGVPVSFATWENHFRPSASGRAMSAVLRHLALITPARTTSRNGFTEWAAEAVREHGGVFLQGELAPPNGLPPCEIVRL